MKKIVSNISLRLCKIFFVAVVAWSFGGFSYAGDQIRITGSSTVYPFTTLVAERFGRTTKFKTPIVESTGTGGGLKIFCSKVGDGSVDFTNASRKIKSKELKKCKKNGISVTEFVIGIDGIVLANSNKKAIMKITVPQLYLALAKKVKIQGKMVDNPYNLWSDIDSSLPTRKIEIIGPPPSSGTRDALVSLVMKKGAKSFGIKSKKYYALLREDGHFIEAGENDNLIIQKLNANTNAFGIFGYSFLEENRDTLNAARIDGVAPTYDTISTFQYPVARYLYIYIKRENVSSTTGMKAFLREYTSEDALGEEGYLAEHGLISLPVEQRQKIIENVWALNPLD